MKRINYMPKEKDIKKAVMQLLAIYEKQEKLITIRNNSFAGFIQRTDGYKSYINNAKKGMADVMVFFPGGKAEFWELKSSIGKQKPAQLEFEVKVEKLGFDYRIIRSLEEAQGRLKLI